MTSERITHLQLVQNIIERLNRNSFQIKEVCVTLITALMALYASSGNSKYVLISIIPTIMSSLLDAYYLQQERKFRGLYYDIVNGVDKVKVFDMSISLYQDGQYGYLNVVRSRSIVIFYGLLTLVILAVGILSRF